jgi:NAD(P)-dependent dehydrogenase (short-subunit alcohol dehydrogenase family)
MTTTTRVYSDVSTPHLLGQTVVAIGGSGGIGLETARLARSEGADVILAGRNPDRLERAAHELDARSTSAFDATNADDLQRFFDELPEPVDHVMVTAGGAYYAPLVDVDFAEANHQIEEHLWLAIRIARAALATVRPPGTLIFMGGTGGRRPGPGLTISAVVTAALPALIANLALEIAPIRVNLIAAGFVDTPLSAGLLGDDLEARRSRLRSELPIHRVVEPADVAALAVHLMTNTALTGATYDIDGGQQILPT